MALSGNMWREVLIYATYAGNFIEDETLVS